MFLSFQSNRQKADSKKNSETGFGIKIFFFLNNEKSFSVCSPTLAGEKTNSKFDVPFIPIKSAKGGQQKKFGNWIWNQNFFFFEQRKIIFSLLTNISR